MQNLSRREFVTQAVAAAAVMQLPAALGAQPQPGAAPQQPPAPKPGDGVALHWLEGGAPASVSGATWGVPWPRGAFAKDQAFALKDPKGEPLAMQSWPLAFWPDGSLKWTAHAVGAEAGSSPSFMLTAGEATAPAKPIAVNETDSIVTIDTGVVRWKIARGGSKVIESVERDGKTLARDAHLVLKTKEVYTGEIEKATVEQSGPLRAVIKLEGRHKGSQDRSWLPFVVRLYFYAGSDSVRMMHSFVFDGDEQKDLISGLGVRFTVPMRDEPQDRHIRVVGTDNGLWGEAVKGLTGLRRDAGQAARAAQVAGAATPPVDQLPAPVRERMQYIPAWGDFTLTQLSADGFGIRKRTKDGHGWIPCGAGTRASGVGYVGGISGGVAFGLRDFWQRHPTQLDIRGAHTDESEVTVWLWSPEAPPMDLRFYHDGMGMETHPEELRGLDITYEDYEKGFGTPVGIARTSELYLQAAAATPSRQALVDFAASVRTPPMVVCAPEHYVATQIFGSLFSVPDRSHPVKARIEDRLDFLLGYYMKQVEQHRWYGFWDYGDVMHSYDPDRHVWRYDVGGFAWANSELSPDIWLWYSFLRSGRADVFRLAEAMTRHTGEVDVYHLGQFKMLGSRHNVQHWGCSAKQLRISTATNRRFYYYLTADERVGDLMRELLDADQTFLTLDPIRKIRQGAYAPRPEALGVGFGTDWGSLAAAWLTEWERDPDTKYRDKLFNGMKTIGQMPHGFFTSGAFYDLATGKFTLVEQGPPGASHLSAVFGLVEICAELNMLVEDPGFEKAWLQYCRLFNASPDEQARELGRGLGRLNLGEAHSRLTAYASKRLNDKALAERAWREFIGGAAGFGMRRVLEARRIEGPAVLNPVDEAAWVSTNAASQWGLAAIQNLALAGDSIPAEPADNR